MRKNYKKYYHILNFANCDYLLISFLFGIILYFEFKFFIILSIILYYLLRKKLLGCFLLCVSLLFLNTPKDIDVSTIKIIELADTYTIVESEQQKFITKKLDYAYYDELSVDAKQYKLENNAFLKKYNIENRLIIKNIFDVKKSNHIKALLYRYIDTNFKEEIKTLLLSTFFGFKINNYLFYSFQFYMLLLIQIVTKKSKIIGIFINFFFLLFNFKFFLIKQLIENVITICHPHFSTNTQKIGLIMFICLIIHPNAVYDISFYYYVVFKLSYLFFKHHKLKIKLLCLLNLLFFHKITFLSIFFYKYMRYFVLTNFFICLCLLLFPNLLNNYLLFIINTLNSIPDISWYKTLDILELIICLSLLLSQKRFCRFLFFIVLLLPNHYRLYQEIIIVPTKESPLIIYKENFGKLPVIIFDKEISPQQLKEYGISNYLTENENIKQIKNSYLFYLNDVFYFGNDNLDMYKPFTINHYIGAKFNKKIIETFKIEDAIYFYNYDFTQTEGEKLRSYHIPYISINYPIFFIYIGSFRFFIN